MSSETFSIAELRKSLKRINYRLKTVRNSEFIAGKIVDANNIAINAGNVFSEAFLDAHKAAFEIHARFKGKTFSDGWRVVI